MILIADDFPDTCRALQLLLEHEGYPAICVDNADKAIEMIPQLKPQLVILDASMPERSGFDVIQELRESKGIKDIPIVFYSAFSKPSMIAQGNQLGAAGWLVKGRSSWEEIRQTVARLYPHPERSDGLEQSFPS